MNCVNMDAKDVVRERLKRAFYERANNLYTKLRLDGEEAIRFIEKCINDERITYKKLLQYKAGTIPRSNEECIALARALNYDDNYFVTKEVIKEINSGDIVVDRRNPSYITYLDNKNHEVIRDCVYVEEGVVKLDYNSLSYINNVFGNNLKFYMMCRGDKPRDLDINAGVKDSDIKYIIEKGIKKFAENVKYLNDIPYDKEGKYVEDVINKIKKYYKVSTDELYKPITTDSSVEELRLYLMMG